MPRKIPAAVAAVVTPRPSLAAAWGEGLMAVHGTALRLEARGVAAAPETPSTQSEAREATV
ncbi:MAG: hypothetical protein FWD77_11125 [Betaproteobacteria bacterium]|nr:hypothetical protein [Betaproteobacteria bacterium]